MRYARCLRRLEIAGVSQKLTPIKSAANGRAGHQFEAPFFDNYGSEHINYKVAKLLEKLCIELTKSRPHHSNDNALAESKNGAVVRKHLGYAHIPNQFAEMVNALCADFLNPQVNFHRPCFFPETVTDAKGKERKRYRHEEMMTPYKKLKNSPNQAISQARRDV